MVGIRIEIEQQFICEKCAHQMCAQNYIHCDQSEIEGENMKIMCV